MLCPFSPESHVEQICSGLPAVLRGSEQAQEGAGEGRWGCGKVSRWQQAGAVSGAGQSSPGSCSSVPVRAAQPQQPNAKFAGVKLALFVIFMWSLASQAVCCLLDESIKYWLDQLGLWSVLLELRVKGALPKLEPGCSCPAQHRDSLVFSAVSCVDEEQHPQGMCGARYHQP